MLCEPVLRMIQDRARAADLDADHRIAGRFAARCWSTIG